ncbi:MAG: YebC/PmpR family DNA-binding transcriptional regulator [Ignavibacteria bacterium]
MSGHSKWATIKRKKAATDSARGRVFTKIIKEITISARDGGGDPDANPRLRLAIQTAKGNNMPQENITRAIKKGTGELEGVKYEEITYEGYAPHGIAMIIESVTDNKNRTVAELRHTMSKNNCNLGESGSVAWMFERKGVVNVEKNNINEDDLMEVVMDNGGDDLKSEGDYYEVISPIENFEKVRKAIEEKTYKIESASLQYIAKDLLPIEGKHIDEVIRCIESIEDNDDIQNVYTNADFAEE